MFKLFMRLVANELLGNKLKVEFASLRILGKGYLTAPSCEI